MKSLQDAFYNWLTIKVVAEARPEDHSAQETTELFRSILKDTHGVESITIEKDDVMYHLSFLQNGEEKQTRFPIELIDIMLIQMQSAPYKYKNYNN